MRGLENIVDAVDADGEGGGGVGRADRSRAGEAVAQALPRSSEQGGGLGASSSISRRTWCMCAVGSLLALYLKLRGLAWGVSWVFVLAPPWLTVACVLFRDAIPAMLSKVEQALGGQLQIDNDRQALPVWAGFQDRFGLSLGGGREWELAERDPWVSNHWAAGVGGVLMALALALVLAFLSIVGLQLEIVFIAPALEWQVLAPLAAALACVTVSLLCNGVLGASQDGDTVGEEGGEWAGCGSCAQRSWYVATVMACALYAVVRVMREVARAGGVREVEEAAWSAAMGPLLVVTAAPIPLLGALILWALRGGRAFHDIPLQPRGGSSARNAGETRGSAGRTPGSRQSREAGASSDAGDGGRQGRLVQRAVWGVAWARVRAAVILLLLLLSQVGRVCMHAYNNTDKHASIA